MKVFFLRHAQVCLTSLGQLVRTPFSTVMSVGVIGITLALPALLYILMTNVEQISNGWRSGANVSLFLSSGVQEEQVRSLASRIRQRGDIERVEIITADQALAEFKELSGFGEALDALPSNPLPTSLIVTPKARHQPPDALQELVKELQTVPGVELVQMDIAWMQRLQVILSLARRGLMVFAALLSLAVLLIVSNTIRLAILNRREEIEIIQLFGGTDRFIRRPFLYSGVLQGLLGAWVAMLLIGISLHLMSDTVTALAELYGSGFRLSGLTAGELSLLVVTGAGLGWLASRWSVSRHLAGMRPS